MDLQEEREAFEAVTSIYHCIYNADLNYYFSGSKFVGNKAEIEVNAGWKAWQAAKAQTVPKWISVKDKLPKEKQWVLIRVACSDYFNVEQGMYRGDGRWMNCWCANRHNDLYPVTHWMPLPESPQEPAND